MSLKEKGITTAVALVAVLVATGPPAAAGEYQQGSSYVEDRGGVYDTSGAEARRVSSQGGAAGVYVANGLALEAEGLGYSTDSQAANTPDGKAVGLSEEADAVGANVGAKWHVVHGKQGSVHLGAGTGLLSDGEKALGSRTLSQTNNADVGLTLNMSESVSLKAQTRYQQIGGLGGKGATEAMGGNLGIKISF